MATRGMNTSDLDRREMFLRDLARSAGAIASVGFKERRFEMKGPQDFITETDGAIEAHVRSALSEAFPEDGFLGEETGHQAGSNIWVVDPIDGTANFARGIPHYCIAIAFVCDNRAELGLIYNPSLDDLYFARRGRGAVLNGAPIRVAGTTSFERATVELGWSNRRSNDRYLAIFAALLESGANVRRAGSGALGLSYVADGRSDAYAEMHMNPWDCVAGLLLVKEAGGVVGPYLRDGGLLKGGPVIASAPGVAEGVSKATGFALAP